MRYDEIMARDYLHDSRIVGAFQRDNKFNLLDHLEMLCFVGSISHGTYVQKHIDDVDLFGVVTPPASTLLGLEKWESARIQVDELDVVLYSTKKYVQMLTKSNPNVTGTLWMEDKHYLYLSDQFKDLRKNREWFSSLRAYYAFMGYAQSQLKRMTCVENQYQGYMGTKRKALVDKYGYDPKNASHLIRLYRMGYEFVQTGVLQVERPDALELLAIKNGAWSLEQVKQEATRLEEKMIAAKEESKLPHYPDTWSINNWLTAHHLNRFGRI